MEDIYLFHVVVNKEVIMSNLPDVLYQEIENCPTSIKIEICPARNIPKKHKKKVFENGFLYVCTYSKEITKRDFQQAFLLFESMLGSFIDFGKRIYGNEVKVLRHNVYDQLTHILDEMKYSISMDDISVKEWPQIVNSAAKNVKEDSEIVAKAILKTIKCANIAISEFDALDIVNSEESPNIHLHSIHKVTKLSLQPFIYDFWDKRIKISLKDSFDNVLIDYDFVNLSLNHFWNNALKYSKPNETIVISYEREPLVLKMSVEMTSLFISSDERKNIFEKGVSGIEAKRLNLEGSGLGMYYIKKFLNLSKCVFEIIAGDNYFVFNGIKYGCNKFIFKFQVPY